MMYAVVLGTAGGSCLRCAFFIVCPGGRSEGERKFYELGKRYELERKSLRCIFVWSTGVSSVFSCDSFFMDSPCCTGVFEVLRGLGESRAVYV